MAKKDWSPFNPEIPPTKLFLLYEPNEDGSINELLECSDSPHYLRQQAREYFSQCPDVIIAEILPLFKLTKEDRPIVETKLGPGKLY